MGWTLGDAMWGLVEPILAGFSVKKSAYEYPTLFQVPVLTLVTRVTSASPSWTSCVPWVPEVSGEPCPSLQAPYPSAVWPLSDFINDPEFLAVNKGTHS